MIEKSRVHRALHNFSVRKDYEHEIAFPEEHRLKYNDAYTWAIEKFGEPGESWDFYIVKEYGLGASLRNRYGIVVGPVQREMWIDIFGFERSEDATLFILRWL